MFSLVVIIASAVFFFKVGDTEFDGRGWLFAGISILVSIAGEYFLQWPMLGIALSQVGLFGLVTLFKMYGGHKPRM